MKKLQEQESVIGPNRGSKENPLPLASLPKKIKSESAKESTSQSSSGSETFLSQKKTQELLENEADSGSKIILPKKKKSLMPVPKLPVKDKRVELALKKLKIKPETLATAPPITMLLKKDLKGGLKTALEAMSFATEDQEISAFLKAYSKIPIGARPKVPWEAIAIAAKVNPKHLYGAIRLAVEVHCMNRSRFIAVTNHPSITKARVGFGLAHVGADKDRMALDIQVGAMQGPKAPTINVNQQVASFPGRGGKSKGDEDDGNEVEAQYDSSDGFDRLFPSPDVMQQKLVPIRQRLLEG